MDVATAVAFATVLGLLVGVCYDRLMRKFLAWLNKRFEVKDDD